MTNKVLNIIYNTHNEGKEKAIFLKDLILKCDKSNLFEDVTDTLKFLYKHIPLHFAYEEVVIKELLNSPNLTKEEICSMDKILGEHEVLRVEFQKISEIAFEIEKGNKGQKEEFLKNVIDTINALAKHAEYEDQYLFPIAGAKCSDKMLSTIEKEASRIVS